MASAQHTSVGTRVQVPGTHVKAMNIGPGLMLWNPVLGEGRGQEGPGRTMISQPSQSVSCRVESDTPPLRSTSGLHLNMCLHTHSNMHTCLQT